MIDLSNNNGTRHDFNKVYHKAGQRRVMLKRVEGTQYMDRTFPVLKTAAEKAGLKVGGYNFLHPLDATPSEIATMFENLLGPVRFGHELRDVLDCEFGRPNAVVGKWITAVANDLFKHYRFKPIIYGNGWWLQECQFPRAPGPLWLAAYGRDDGREYPVGRLPRPWTSLAAHQYTSKAHVIGINGECDISHVFEPSQVDIPRRRRA